MFPLVGRSRGTNKDAQERLPKRKIRFQNPFYLLKEIDIFLLLFLNGVHTAVLFGVMASISTLFHEIYSQLDETKIGLCFLSIGGGMIPGTVIGGKLLNWDYRRMRKRFDKSSEAGTAEFPLEKVCQSHLGWVPTDRRVRLDYGFCHFLWSLTLHVALHMDGVCRRQFI